MIFTVTGTQFPFDRLARSLDEWCHRHPEQEVIGQMGKHTSSPQHFMAVEYYPPLEFERVFNSASHIIAHAGMGSVLTARRFGTPILIVPRLVSFKEHRSDHQVATANALRGRPGIVVCDDLASFDECMDQLLAMKRGPATMNAADPSLVTALQRFVDLGEFPD